MKKNLPKGQLPAVILIDPKYPHNVGAALHKVAAAFDRRRSGVEAVVGEQEYVGPEAAFLGDGDRP